MIPYELRELEHWVCWNESKIPYQPCGKPAKANDSSTWSDFETCCNAVREGRFKGVGFQFGDSGYVGIDLDGCVDAGGALDSVATDIMNTVDGYTEISMSGRGLHIIARGSLPHGSRRKDNIEMYDSGRYFALTGTCISGDGDIPDRTDEIRRVHAKYIGRGRMQTGLGDFSDEDAKRLEDIRDKGGLLFRELWSGNWRGDYQSHSEADLALCNILAKYLNKDEDEVDKFFRRSGLYRDEKWDRSVGRGQTYGQRTIEMSCTYVPRTAVPGEKTYDRTDTGNAERFFDMFGNSYRYSYENKLWYIWNGKIWEPDMRGQIKSLYDIMLESMKEEADGDEKAMKWVLSSANSGKKESALREAQHIGNTPILMEDFDTQKTLFCCDNGVINVLTGDLLPHDPAYMQTRLSGIPLGSGEPVQFLKFLDEIFDGDGELVRFIQKATGLSLTGDTSEQCLFFLYGTGKNGKSTFLEIINHVVGSYCAHAQPETIMVKGGASSGQDIARLKGARMVTTVEPNQGSYLNEGLIKQLTGGDKVTARFLYGREFEFYPEFKIWLAGNHKPTIRGTDDGIWRRIRLIPFDVQIQEVDKTLSKRICATESPQILNWMLEGARMWVDEGLGEAQSINLATQEYRSDSDVLGLFIDDCIELGEGSASGGEIYRAFREWAELTNNDKRNAQSFGRAFAERFGDMRRRDGRRGNVYVGLNIVGSTQTAFDE